MYVEQKIEVLLEEIRSINAKVDRISTEMDSIKKYIERPLPEDFLKDKYSEFKNNWNSESPEIQGLKENLLKLKGSLGGLASMLSDGVPQENQGEQKTEQK